MAKISITVYFGSQKISGKRTVEDGFNFEEIKKEFNSEISDIARLRTDGKGAVFQSDIDNGKIIVFNPDAIKITID